MDRSNPRSSGDGNTNNKSRHKGEIEDPTDQEGPSKNTNAPNTKIEGILEPNAGTRDKGDTNVAYTDAPISADDVIRAGGLGARDDMSSFLPVAIDSTDFEASLRDARDFEEPQGEIRRPGLGWTDPINRK